MPAAQPGQDVPPAPGAGVTLDGARAEVRTGATVMSVEGAGIEGLGAVSGHQL